MTGNAPTFATLLLRVFVPFALAYFLSYIFRGVNAVIFPYLERDVGISAGDLGLLTSAFFLFFAGCQPILGVMLEITNRVGDVAARTFPHRQAQSRIRVGEAFRNLAYAFHQLRANADKVLPERLFPVAQAQSCFLHRIPLRRPLAFCRHCYALPLLKFNFLLSSSQNLAA